MYLFGSTRCCAVVVAGVISVAVSAPAFSQDLAGSELSAAQYSTLAQYDRGRNVAVLERDRPEYSAQGIMAGGFTVYPKLGLSLAEDSNIFATQHDKKSATVAHYDPSLSAVSNWGRHQLSLSTGAKIREVFNHSTEDEQAWFVNGSGRLDVHGQSFLTANATAQRRYQERTSTDFPANAKSPIPFTDIGGGLSGVYQQDRLRVKVGGDAHQFRYSNVDLTTGGRLDNQGRNNNFYDGQIRAEWALTPDKALFLNPAITRTTYEQSGGVFGANRESTEYAVLGGANFDITAVIRGEVGVGYVSREYDNHAFGTISGFALSSKVEYFPTELTTVTFTAHRVIRDSITLGAAGYFDTAGGVRIDHELRRNVLLNLGGSLGVLDYKNIDRKDHLYEATGGATYLVNRSAGINLFLTYLKRTPKGAAATTGFDDVVAGVGVTLQR